MRRRLERSEVRTLVILAVGLVIGVGSIWVAASEPMTRRLRKIIAQTCPHWTEC